MPVQPISTPSHSQRKVRRRSGAHAEAKARTAGIVEQKGALRDGLRLEVCCPYPATTISEEDFEGVVA